jgi:Domain of unknown function (DUF4331)
MSHHISGPRALAVPAADITDMYAFPSPERSGHLVLILNVLPFASPSAYFSDAITYRFRVRPIAAITDGDVPFSVDAEELTIDCSFSAPMEGSGDAQSIQHGRCSISTGTEIDFLVNAADSAGSDEMRIFAGPRRDPFFMDARAALETSVAGRLAFTRPGAIVADGKNVLSIVLEADCATPLGGQTPVAVVGETLIAGKLPVRWEHVGRPELLNLIMAMKQYDQVNRDLEIRDLFNAEDAFDLGETYLGAYRARLNANLSYWDNLDGKVDWPLNEQGAHPLTDLLLADYLIVDTSKPYAEDSYFEIERATLAGRPHETCGGRSLNDDVMDTIFTLLVNGGNGPRISDGVDRATIPAAKTFPYLVPANPTPPDLPPHP